MNAWPGELTVDPIGEWPTEYTLHRQPSKFKATLEATLDLLAREVHFLNGKNVRLQVAIPPGKFRRDGRPYADAKAEHPGVILTLDSKHGPLSYPCDTFTSWQHNLRAIALSLDSLRAVDRYGVTKRGEQYRGSLAIEAPIKLGMTVESATRLIYTAARIVFDQRKITPTIVRRAKFYTHPDTADEHNDPDDYARVVAAEQYLTQKGIL